MNMNQKRRRKTVDISTETPKLSLEEKAQADRAFAIPAPVCRALVVRMNEITRQITELAREKQCLEDFLDGKVSE